MLRQNEKENMWAEITKWNSKKKKSNRYTTITVFSTTTTII